MPIEARYANYLSVGHANCEIILEFGQHYEGDVTPIAHTRIVTSPLNANRFLDLLKESLEQYYLGSGGKGNPDE